MADTLFSQIVAGIHPHLAGLADHIEQLGHPFTLAHANPALHRARLLSTSVPAGSSPTQVHAHIGPPGERVDQILARMPQLSGVVSGALASGEKPFANHSIFLVHHLSLEILGAIAALRRLGCRDIVTVFVGYNADAEKIYRPDLDDLPEDEFRCYILGTQRGSGESAEPAYHVPRSFVKQPASETTTVLDELDRTMQDRKLDFIGAMRALIVQMSLAQLARCRKAGRKLMVIEDGGYTAPILNDAALSGIDVTQFRANFHASSDSATDAGLPPAMKDVISAAMFGSIEHTRNGCDHNMRTYLKHNALAVPAFSIAVSYIKTQVESDTVAASILNAVRSVLYSDGVVLHRRRGLVFGSRGNIGRRLMIHLHDSLEDPDHTLSGCDLKVGRADPATKIPDWQFHPSQSCAGGSSEVAAYAQLDAQRKQDLDLIIGVTGGPTPGYPVLQVDDLVQWLLEGRQRELYLASGSSKTDEFPEILEWMNQLLEKATAENPVVDALIGGRRARVQRQDVIDALSLRNFGSRYVIAMEQDDHSYRDRVLLFIQNLMPANFLFYGCPTEVIDVVLAQLVSAGVALTAAAAALPEKRLYAVDFDPEASKGVYGARPPANGARIALPLPATS